MPERSLEAFEFKAPKPKAIGFIIIILIVLIFVWGSFVIIPAGHRGVVLWWGSVGKRIMGEGLNYKVPFAERVIKVDVRVQPHPFKEIDAASKEYQIVKLTGMMNFHIDPSYVNVERQKL
jgi:regulator of protease activity HflC (stomatin/prohibitin superfamily)